MCPSPGVCPSEPSSSTSSAAPSSSLLPSPASSASSRSRSTSPLSAPAPCLPHFYFLPHLSPSRWSFSLLLLLLCSVSSDQTEHVRIHHVSPKSCPAETGCSVLVWGSGFEEGNQTFSLRSSSSAEQLLIEAVGVNTTQAMLRMPPVEQPGWWILRSISDATTPLDVLDLNGAAFFNYWDRSTIRFVSMSPAFGSCLPGKKLTIHAEVEGVPLERPILHLEGYGFEFYLPVAVSPSGNDLTFKTAEISSLSDVVLNVSFSPNGVQMLPLDFAITFKAEPPYKIGFLMYNDQETIGWSSAVDMGRIFVAHELGVAVQTTVAAPVRSPDAAYSVGKQLVEAGYTMIVGVHFVHQQPLGLPRLAREFPNVAFVLNHDGGFESGPANVGTTVGRLYEGRYVTGFVAGAMSKSGVLAYICSFPMPETARQINAFTLGAQLSNPNIKVLVMYVMSWHDDEGDMYAAYELMARGADVMAHHTNSLAAQRIFGDAGLYTLGIFSDYSFLGRWVLCSTYLSWGPAFVHFASAIVNGEFTDENIWGGVAADMVIVSDFSDRVPPEIQAEARRQLHLLRAGKNVFCGPLSNDQGELMLEADRCLTDADLVTGQWLIQGVTNLGEFRRPVCPTGTFEHRNISWLGCVSCAAASTGMLAEHPVECSVVAPDRPREIPVYLVAAMVGLLVLVAGMVCLFKEHIMSGFRCCFHSRPLVFISYAHDNADFAKGFVTTLEDAGFLVWIDEQITPGSDWRKNIATHIEESAAVVLLLSSSSATSRYCKEEIFYAVTLKIPIFPVQIPGHNVFSTLTGGLKMILQRIQWIDFSEGETQQGYQSLVTNMRVATEGARQYGPDAGDQGELGARYDSTSDPEPGRSLSSTARARATQKKETVFISYDVKDQALMTTLEEWLTSRGFIVFVAVRGVRGVFTPALAEDASKRQQQALDKFIAAEHDRNGTPPDKKDLDKDANLARGLLTSTIRASSPTTETSASVPLSDVQRSLSPTTAHRLSRFEPPRLNLPHPAIGNKDTRQAVKHSAQARKTLSPRSAQTLQLQSYALKLGKTDAVRHGDSGKEVGFVDHFPKTPTRPATDARRTSPRLRSRVRAGNRQSTPEIRHNARRRTPDIRKRTRRHKQKPTVLHLPPAQRHTWGTSDRRQSSSSERRNSEGDLERRARLRSRRLSPSSDSVLWGRETVKLGVATDVDSVDGVGVVDAVEVETSSWMFRGGRDSRSSGRSYSPTHSYSKHSNSPDIFPSEVFPPRATRSRSSTRMIGKKEKKASEVPSAIAPCPAPDLPPLDASKRKGTPWPPSASGSSFSMENEPSRKSLSSCKAKSGDVSALSGYISSSADVESGDVESGDVSLHVRPCNHSAGGADGVQRLSPRNSEERNVGVSTRLAPGRRVLPGAHLPPASSPLPREETEPLHTYTTYPAQSAATTPHSLRLASGKGRGSMSVSFRGESIRPSASRRRASDTIRKSVRDSSQSPVAHRSRDFLDGVARGGSVVRPRPQGDNIASQSFSRTGTAAPVPSPAAEEYDPFEFNAYQMDRCFCFLVLLSNNSLNSSEVGDELHYSYENRCPIIPVEVQGTTNPSGSMGLMLQDRLKWIQIDPNDPKDPIALIQLLLQVAQAQAKMLRRARGMVEPDAEPTKIQKVLSSRKAKLRPSVMTKLRSSGGSPRLVQPRLMRLASISRGTPFSSVITKRPALASQIRMDSRSIYQRPIVVDGCSVGPQHQHSIISAQCESHLDNSMHYQTSGRDSEFFKFNSPLVPFSVNNFPSPLRLTRADMSPGNARRSITSSGSHRRNTSGGRSGRRVEKTEVGTERADWTRPSASIPSKAKQMPKEEHRFIRARWPSGASDAEQTDEEDFVQVRQSDSCLRDRQSTVSMPDLSVSSSTNNTPRARHRRAQGVEQRGDKEMAQVSESRERAGSGISKPPSPSVSTLFGGGGLEIKFHSSSYSVSAGVGDGRDHSSSRIRKTSASNSSRATSPKTTPSSRSTTLASLAPRTPLRTPTPTTPIAAVRTTTPPFPSLSTSRSRTSCTSPPNAPPPPTLVISIPRTITPPITCTSTASTPLAFRTPTPSQTPTTATTTTSTTTTTTTTITTTTAASTTTPRAASTSCTSTHTTAPGT